MSWVVWFWKWAEAQLRRMGSNPMLKHGVNERQNSRGFSREKKVSLELGILSYGYYFRTVNFYLPPDGDDELSVVLIRRHERMCFTNFKHKHHDTGFSKSPRSRWKNEQIF